MKFLLAVTLVMGFVVGIHVFGASNQAGHEPVFSTIHASVHSSLVKMLYDSEIMDIGFLTTRIFIYFKACPTLYNPRGGSVSTPEGTEFEDEAIYECKQGFELIGDSRRYCRSTGSWSGTEPTCRSLLKDQSKC